ncbi:hypothetical protein FRC10_009544 [Ceratobasidium sp. 414]|nr:hypothetical protein FRC10_009544 [Ceratobasidium sp. 414]
MAYLELLIQRSNRSLGNLWTTSELQAVQLDGEVLANAATSGGEPHDDIPPADDEKTGEETDDEDDVFCPPRSVRNNHSGSVQVPARSMRSRRPNLFGPLLLTIPVAASSTAPATPSTPTIPSALTTSLAPTTPPNSCTTPEIPLTDRTIPIRQGIDRTRIADFAVAYLKAKPEGIRMIFDIEVPLLDVFHIPIIVEGKRPPSREVYISKPEVWPDFIRRNLDEAKDDIYIKQSVFFGAYPSRSYIGIAFSGPWWAFTICTRESPQALRWSKAFAYHTQAHQDAFDVIFRTAQDHPGNPQEDRQLIELLNQYEETEDTLTFVK